MWISEGARKHGIEDADIEHGVRNAMRRIPRDDGAVLLIGPDRAGRMLELILIDVDSDEPIVIHADTLRPKFYGYL